MPYKLKDPYRHKFDKVQYRLANSSDYNQSLKSRGDINIWFTDEIIKQWYHKSDKCKLQGRQKLYPNLAILTMRTLGTIYNQRLRQTQGLVEYIVSLMGISLTVPHFSTLSRRAANLIVPNLSAMLEHNSTIDIIIDSTGLKILGPNEWCGGKFGNKRKSWHKLHIAIDKDSQNIIACELTPQEIGEQDVVSDLLQQIPNDINKVIADMGYDSSWVYKEIQARNATPIVPPRPKNLLSEKYWEKLSPRDILMLDRCELGKQKWQQVSGYNKRSLVETAMFRYKKIIGQGLHARKSMNQAMEAKLGCYILNKMTELGAANSSKFKKANIA